MILTLYTPSREKRLQIIPSSADRCTQRLMGEHTLTLTYTHETYVPLQVGDYLDYQGERYYLLQSYQPEMISSIEYRYNLRLVSEVGFLSHAKVIKPDSHDAELDFALDARPHEHLQLIVENANRITQSRDWTIGTVIQGESRNIDYRNKSCLDALADIAKAYNTEWWVNGRTINLCRCEWGTPIPLGYGKGLERGISRLPNTTAKHFTRLYPQGSRRNIIPSDYGHSRLQLPQGQTYLERNTHLGIFEESAEEPFAHIYPRYTGTISRVRSEQKQDEEGKTYPIYFVQDEALPFNPEQHMIAGQVIHLSFQSGELHGRDFEVNWHEKNKEWEIIAQRPYENQLIPSGRLIPAVGDTYIPYNMRMPRTYIERAEQELQEAAQAYLERISEDTSLYKAHTDYIHLQEAGISLSLGQRVLLTDKQLFAHTSGEHPSRITAISRSVLLPTDMDLEMTHALDIGRVAQLEGGVQDLRAAYQEARATLPTILKTWDSADPSDYNVLSALRTLLAIERTALRKDKDDYTEHSIGSRGVIPGIEGWLLKPNGDAYLRNLKIAGALEVDELRKNRITILEGEHYFSSGTAIVQEVNPQEGYIIDTLEAGEHTSLVVGDYCIGKWVGSSGAVEVVKLKVVRLEGERIYYSLAPESISHPRIGMHIAQVGHESDARRQRATLIRNNVIIQYAGLSGWDIQPLHITGLYGDLDDFVLPNFGALRGSGLMTTNAYIAGQLLLQSADGSSTQPLGYDKGLWRNGSIAHPHDKFIYQERVWMWMGTTPTTSEPNTQNRGWVDMGITAQEAARDAAAREVARLNGGLSEELRRLISEAQGRSQGVSRSERLKVLREQVSLERDRLREVYGKLRTDKRLPRERGVSLENHWINVNGAHEVLYRACTTAIATPSDGNMTLVERAMQDFRTKVVALEQAIAEAERAIREAIYHEARGRTRVKIEGKSLDPNKYYPLIIKLNAPYKEVTTYGIRLERPLYDKPLGVPPYASHASGYSLLLEWSVQAAGWGAQAENRKVYTYQTKFLRDGERVITAPAQETRASWEYLYVRGGSDLWVEVTGATNLEIAIYPEGAEWVGGTSNRRWDVLESIDTLPEPKIELDVLSEKLLSEIAKQRTALQTAIEQAKSATAADYEARVQEVLGRIGTLDGLLRDNVATLQKQIDKQVERFFGSDIAQNGVPPTDLWERSEDAKHEGDTYTCTAPKGVTITPTNAHQYPNVGKSWRWTNGGSGNVYGWELIADTDITQALALAAKAQATADGKMSHYIGDTPPTTYREGDQWTLTASWQGRKAGRAHTYPSGSILTATAHSIAGQYRSEHWVELVRYTDDSKIDNLKIGGRNLARRTTTRSWRAFGANLSINPPIIRVEQGDRDVLGAEQIHRLMRLEQGVEYTLSFLARGNTALNYCYLMCNGADNQRFTDVHHQTNEEEWRKLEYRITPNAATASASGIGLLIAGISNMRERWFEVKDIMLEEGNKPSAWTPAPEDMQEEIEDTKRALQEQIDQANAAIATAQALATQAKAQADKSVADALAGDGKIDALERRSIAQAVDAYRKSVATEWGRLLSAYTTLKASDYLIAKQSLINAYNTAKQRYDSLKAQMDNILSDRSVTQTEYATYTSAYEAYRSAVQPLVQAIEDASKAIQAELARRANEAKEEANRAGRGAQDAQRAADDAGRKAEEAGRKADDAQENAENARRAAAGLEYLRTALKEGTTSIEGGLTLGNIIAVKNQAEEVVGYLNGLVNHPNDPLFALGVKGAFTGNQSEMLAFRGNGTLWIGDLGIRDTGETIEMIIAERGTRDFDRATIRFGGVQPSYNDFIESSNRTQTSTFNAQEELIPQITQSVRSPQYGSSILTSRRIFNNHSSIGDMGAIHFRPTGKIRVRGRISLIRSCAIEDQTGRTIADNASVLFRVNITLGGASFTIHSAWGESGSSSHDRGINIDAYFRGLNSAGLQRPGIEVTAHYYGKHEGVSRVLASTALGLEAPLTLEYQDYDPDFREVSIGSFGLILNKGHQNFVAMLSGRDVPILAAQGDIDLPNTTLYCATFDPSQVDQTFVSKKYVRPLQASGWYAPKGDEWCSYTSEGYYFVAHSIGHTDYNVQISLESDSFLGFVTYKHKGASGVWVYIKDAQGRPKHCPFSIACTGRNYDKTK